MMQGQAVQATGYAQMQPPASQESVSNVLGQTDAQLLEVETRLTNLRDRIQQRMDKLGAAEKAASAAGGVLSQSVGLRNTAARLQNLCNELDCLL